MKLASDRDHYLDGLRRVNFYGWPAPGNQDTSNPDPPAAPVFRIAANFSQF